MERLPPACESPIQFFRGKRVLVVGASGFYGSHLAGRLAALGADVFSVSRLRRDDEPGCIWVKSDFANLDDARQALTLARPHIIYHLTSESRGERDLNQVIPSLLSDVVATVNSLVAAAELAPYARFVMTTSMEEPQGRLGKADAEPVPAAPYAAGKACAALYGRMFHRLYGVPVVILRPFSTYGYGQKAQKVVPYTIKSLLGGISPRLTSATRRIDYIYIDDMVDALLRAGHFPQAVGETMDIGTGKTISVREMVEAIHQRIGGPAPQFSVLPDRPSLSASRIAEVERCADTRLATEKLRWRPMTTLDCGLMRTIETYRREIFGHLSPALKSRAYAAAALLNSCFSEILAVV